MKATISSLLLSLLLTVQVYGQAPKYDLLIEKSTSYLDEYKLDSAFHYAQQAFRLAPERIEGIYYLGVCHALQCFEEGNEQDCLKGIQLLDKTDSIQSGYRNLFALRASCKQGIMDLYGAIEDYEAAIAQQADPELFSEKAHIFLTMGEFSLALQDITKAIELDSSDVFYVLNRALIHQEASDFDAALADLDVAISLCPDSAFIYTEKATTLFLADRHSEAKTFFDKSLALEPDNADVYHDRGYLKYFLEDLDGALQDLNKAVQLAPDDADSYFIRGMIKIERGENGCSDLRKSIDLGKTEAMIDYTTHCGDE